MPFIYNLEDLKKIPGYSTDGNPIPYLTPIFFDQKVLIRYFYDPTYKCEFSSETYGTIYCPENDDYSDSFPFGINPNKKVIAWYGDIMKLNPSEITYLESCNIDSDGNLDSEFYDAQIKTDFTPSIKEVDLILFKTKISELTERIFGFRLYKTTEQTTEEIIALCSRYKRIVFNSKDDFKKILSTWNEDLVEDLDVSALKECISKNGVRLEKGTKGNKLVELFIKEILKISENIIAPMFYLYDLRLWSDHKGMETTYEEVVKGLNLSNDVKSIDVYSKLIEVIYEYYSKLNVSLLDYENSHTST